MASGSLTGLSFLSAPFGQTYSTYQMNLNSVKAVLRPLDMSYSIKYSSVICTWRESGSLFSAAVGSGIFTRLAKEQRDVRSYKEFRWLPMLSID